MFLYFKRREKRGKREAPRPRFLVLRRKTLTVGAALLAAAAIFGAVNAPAAVRASVATRQLPIYCVERDQKVCSISFDAAWGADNTQKILDVLADYGVKCTFFVVGNYLETSPELVKQMIAEGHTVANHTYHHPDMSRISDKAAFEKELTALETLYQSVTGQTMKKYYRPPQGKYSESNLQMAKELGYKTFFWSLAYVDWMQDQQPSKEEAFSKLLTRIHPGAIVLLHSTSQTNAQILDELLAKWEEMGYSFKTLEEF